MFFSCNCVLLFDFSVVYCVISSLGGAFSVVPDAWLLLGLRSFVASCVTSRLLGMQLERSDFVEGVLISTFMGEVWCLGDCFAALLWSFSNKSK